MSKIDKKYVEYLIGSDTGISSKAMMCVFINIKNTSYYGNDAPYDPADFGRCHRLLEKFPELKDKMELLKKFKVWKPLIENWDKLTELYIEELPTNRCPKLYKLMRELRGRS